MEIDLSSFRDVFFQESDEHLAEMEAGLLHLEGNPDPELLNAVFRGAHSIKGASGTFGLEGVMHFTHAMEGLLDRMRSGHVDPSRERIDLLLEALDVLRRLLEDARTGVSGATPPEETERVAQLLLAAQSGDFPPAPAVAVTLGNASMGNARPANAPAPDARRRWSIRFAPSGEVFRQGLDPALILRELSRLGDVQRIQPDLSRLPDLARLEPDTCYLAWNLSLETQAPESEIRDVFAFVEDDGQIEIRCEESQVVPPSHPVPPAREVARTVSHADAGTIRVATGKVDKLIDLVGELVIAQSMATQILAAFRPSDLTRLSEAFAEVERYTRELQERLMGVRMMPVGHVFSRLPRLVRDLAAATGKQVVLEMQGEDTELDKSVVERLSDPLMHLVRNSIDHGIEPPAERLAAQKSAVGTIRLHARHQAGSVVLDVSDDGRGLDRERIFARARKRGLIAEGENLTDERIHSLIFEPGFSTAETVTDISGRGVGMDVVKRSVESLNGTIAVRSEPGRGVAFRIKLPLTLAILDGLLLRVGPQRYVLPLISIMESIAARRGSVTGIAGKGEVIVLRGEPIPLCRLNRLFRVCADCEDLRDSLAVIVEHRGRRLALLVDELLGQQQVVIKSLETHFRKVEGAVGATILGDGQPALILDVAAIAEMARAA